MNLLFFFILIFSLLLSASSRTSKGASFRLVNKCSHPVWPGLLSGAKSPPLPTTGFALKPDKSQTFTFPHSWSGRIWGRTHCAVNAAGKFSCLTGDCASGKVSCGGAGAIPPATLAEFTLNGAGGVDFYDVSLVDGYNLPMLVVPRGGHRGDCSPTGCLVDINEGCPKELSVITTHANASKSNKVGTAVACRSACEAFGNPEYCCSQGYNTPDTCHPSVYSTLFKQACPRSYSYAYDDKTSTFTCASADYIIVFCPPPYTSNKLLGARRMAGELPLVNKSMMHLRSRRIKASPGIQGTTFTFTNKCDYTVWPGILANAGSPKLETTGFQLTTGTTRSILSPTGWSGRFWGRTGCNFDTSTPGYCQTGDCGSGTVECSGSGAEPPATLAEFTLGSGGGDDFYDVSLVDGYNLPVLVEVSGGSGQCASTGCIVDLNRVCPAELKSGGGDACKSACEAFGNPEYCCSGAYGTPDKCRPTVYSQMFKAACPRSYSYAYDDASSTFTCRGADYAITFCPSTPSQKSSRDTTTPVTTTPVTTPVTTTPPDFSGSDPIGSTSTPVSPGLDPTGSTTTPVSYGSDPMGSTSTAGSGADMTYGAATDGDVSGTYTQPGSDDATGTGTTTSAMLSDGSWLAGLAMGGSVTVGPRLTLALGSSILTSVILTIFSL